MLWCKITSMVLSILLGASYLVRSNWALCKCLVDWFWYFIFEHLLVSFHGAKLPEPLWAAFLCQTYQNKAIFGLLYSNPRRCGINGPFVFLFILWLERSVFVFLMVLREQMRYYLQEKMPQYGSVLLPEQLACLWRRRLSLWFAL